MRLGVENAPNEGDIKIHVEGGVEGANDDSCRIPKECCFFYLNYVVLWREK